MLAANPKKKIIIESSSYSTNRRERTQPNFNKYKEVYMLAYPTQGSLKKVDEKKKHYGPKTPR